MVYYAMQVRQRLAHGRPIQAEAVHELLERQKPMRAKQCCVNLNVLVEEIHAVLEARRVNAAAVERVLPQVEKIIRDERT